MLDQRYYMILIVTHLVRNMRQPACSSASPLLESYNYDLARSTDTTARQIQNTSTEAKKIEEEKEEDKRRKH